MLDETATCLEVWLPEKQKAVDINLCVQTTLSLLLLKRKVITILQ